MELQYVDNTTLRSIQQTELEIAREVKRICDEEGIQYFLDGGTLLGAIRHKGFIPWDDDMDIGMLLEDYNKFIEIAPSKLADRFFLQTWDTDDEFPHAYAKVRKKGTVLKEISSKEDLSHNEIWIDIFTYHSFPKKKLERKIQGMWLTWYKDALLMKKKVAMWKYHKNKMVRLCFYFKYIPPRIYAQIHSSDFLKKKIRDWISKYDSEKTDFVFDNGPLKYGKVAIHRDCFDSFLINEFENEKFKIPIGYDQYLKDLYGDYMTLPPENKRVGHHITEVKV